VEIKQPDFDEARQPAQKKNLARKEREQQKWKAVTSD